jgi:hypothetical protein
VARKLWEEGLCGRSEILSLPPVVDDPIVHCTDSDRVWTECRVEADLVLRWATRSEKILEGADSETGEQPDEPGLASHAPVAQLGTKTPFVEAHPLRHECHRRH